MDGGLKMPKMPKMPSFKNPAAGLAGKIKGKAQGALLKSLIPKNPLSGVKMPSFGSFFGKKASTGSVDPSAVQSVESKGPIPMYIFKIVLIGIFTLFISLFSVYTIKTEKDFNKTSLLKFFLIVIIFLIALGLTVFFKAKTLDFIISSQINIMCLYLLILYLLISGVLVDGPLSGLKKIFKLFSTSTSDPLSVFKNITGVLIPIVLFIIPCLVLLYNATQNIYQTIIVAVLTIGCGSILLSPNDWI
jgi:hypothetical protein